MCPDPPSLHPTLSPKPRLTLYEATYPDGDAALRLLLDAARVLVGPDSLPCVQLWTAGDPHYICLVDLRDLRLYFD